MMEETRLDQMRRKAQEFHLKHPEVWKLFERFTFDRVEKGFKRYSADAIMHRARWETAGGRPDSNGEAPFKICNNHITFYSRAFMRLHPEHEGFFVLREQPSASQEAKPYEGPEDE